MKLTPLCLAGSLAVNVVLVVVFVAGIGSSRSDPVPGTPSVTPPSAEPALTPAVWPGLRVDDLPAFIARLRAEGFPADRIRAIIRAQVHERFAARLKAIEAAENAQPYWRTPEEISGPSSARRAIWREERALLISLLGPDATDISARQRQFPGFSTEKLARLEQLSDDYNDRRSELVARGASFGTTPVGEASDQIAAIERDYQASLTALLTPRELEEFQLRSSDTADNLRDELAAFHPNEAEYRAIFALQHAYDLQFGTSWNTLTPEQRARREAADDKLSNDLRTALGEARFAEYERASDTGFQQITQIATRLNLPEETAAQVWPLKLELEQRASQLLANRQLATEDRARQLAALAEEAKTKLGASLTPRGFEAYRQNSSGWWLRQLTPPVK